VTRLPGSAREAWQRWLGPGGHTDLRLVPAAAVAWAVCWLTPFGRLAGLAMIGLATGIAVVALRMRLFFPRLARGLALTVVVCLATLAVASIQIASVHDGPVARLATDSAVVGLQVRITSDPIRKESSIGGSAYLLIRAAAVEVTGRGQTYRLSVPVLLTAQTSWSAVRPGERYRTVGRLAPTASTDDIAAVVAIRGPPVRIAPAGALDRAAEHLRAGLRQACSRLPPDAAALIPALVVGDVSGVTPELDAAFRATGLTHVTVRCAHENINT
jgi:competence protein ComEC